MPNVTDGPWGAGPGVPINPYSSYTSRIKYLPAEDIVLDFLKFPREVRDGVYRGLLVDAEAGIQPQYKGCSRGYVFGSHYRYKIADSIWRIEAVNAYTSRSCLSIAKCTVRL